MHCIKFGSIPYIVFLLCFTSWRRWVVDLILLRSYSIPISDERRKLKLITCMLWKHVGSGIILPYRSRACIYLTYQICALVGIKPIRKLSMSHEWLLLKGCRTIYTLSMLCLEVLPNKRIFQCMEDLKYFRYFLWHSTVTGIIIGDLH